MGENVSYQEITYRWFGYRGLVKPFSLIQLQAIGESSVSEI